MMKDYRRLLRLWKQGASTRSMADALGVKRDTVRDALARIGKAYGSLDSVPAEASDEEIQERIRSSRDTADCCFMPIDCDDVLGKRRNGDTYDVLWADYVKAAKEKGWRYYGRSRFCEIVSEYARINDITVGIRTGLLYVVRNFLIAADESDGGCAVGSHIGVVDGERDLCLGLRAGRTSFSRLC